jgi:hypothetical protein
MARTSPQAGTGRLFTECYCGISCGGRWWACQESRPADRSKVTQAEVDTAELWQAINRVTGHRPIYAPARPPPRAGRHPVRWGLHTP